MRVIDRLRALPPRSRDRLRLAAECLLVHLVMIAATVVLGVGKSWLWLAIVVIGGTIIERRTKRYRRAYPERPLTLALR